MFVCAGTERARGLAQTLLNIPYGEGEGEKLDVYIPSITSPGVCVCVYTVELMPSPIVELVDVHKTSGD